MINTKIKYINTKTPYTELIIIRGQLHQYIEQQIAGSSNYKKAAYVILFIEKLLKKAK